jgi:hypothetical protein
MQTQQRFWVVGGRYEDMKFLSVEPGTQEVIGPFGEYQEAERTWRQRAMSTKSCARTRYTIAREG